MITLDSVKLGKDKEPLVLEATTCSIPSDRRFILYSDADGRTTLLRAMAGLLRPLDGTITRYCKLSFPLGHTGAFRNDLSVAENLQFVASVFGCDSDALRDFVGSFPGLQVPLAARFASVPANLQTRISFVVAYGLPFDCFLIDGPMAIGGDPAFRAACMQAFADRCRGRYIMSTRHIHQAEAHGACGAVLQDGKLQLFDKIEDLVRAARVARSGQRSQ